MLSNRIDLELQELETQKGLVNRLKKLFDEVVHPNDVTLWHFIMMGGVMLAVAHIPLPHETLLNFKDSNHYQNLIAITAGLGSVIFALTIFVAERFKGEDDIEAKVLLKESDLYFLSILSIFSLIAFSWFDSGILSVSVLSITAFFALRAVYMVFTLLLSKSRLLEKEQQFWNNEVGKSVKDALRNRVGNNIYLKFLDNDHFNLDFSLWIDERQRYVDFKLTKLGTIVDVNFCYLKELEDFLEELAIKNGKTFKSQQETKAVEDSTLSPSLVDVKYSVADVRRSNPVKALVYKRLGDTLDGANPIALSIPISVSVNGSEQELQKLLDKIYVFAEKSPASLRDELNVELRSKKDVAITAIRGGLTNKVEAISNLYVETTTAFLDIMKKAGGGYGWKEANKERGAIIGGWDEVKWVAEDVRDLLAEGVASENERVISVLTRIPLTISLRSIKFSDHFVFQEFLPLYRYFYELSMSVKNPGLKKSLVEKSWKYLTEICDFYVGSELEKKSSSPDTFESYKYYVVDSLKILLVLLKRSFDSNSLSDFEVFQKAVIKIFRNFKPSDSNQDADHYDLMLTRSDLSSELRSEYILERDRQEKLEKIEVEIRELKIELFFGIGAWMLSKLKDHESGVDDFLPFWKILQPSLPSDLIALTKVYCRLRSFDSEQFWGWDWWELEEKGGEGEAVWMDVGGKMDRIYSVLSVQAIGGLTRDQILALPLIIERDMVYSIQGGSSPVRIVLSDIKANAQLWGRVLSTESIAKIDYLFELYDQKTRELEEREESDLINASVSDVKVKEFYQDFEKTFSKHTVVRNVFSFFGKFIRRKRKTATPVLLWGFNQLNDKAAFIENWHVGYPHFGKHYAEELASAEDSRLYAELKSSLPTRVIPKSSFGSSISSILDSITHAESSNDSLVVFTQMFMGEIEDIDGQGVDFKFLRSWEAETNRFSQLPGYLGVYKIGSRVIPVFQIDGHNLEEESFALVDMSKINGVIRHFPYQTNEEKAMTTHDKDFIYQIIDLNSDNQARQAIINKNPTWLSEHSDPDRFLRQKVVLKLMEKVNVDVGSVVAGVVIKLE